MDIQNFVIIALIGIAAGLLSGLLGLGGAIIIIPALVMMVLPVGALAAFQYYEQGYVEVKPALIMAAFFFAGGYFGAKFATHIPQDILKKAFVFVLVAIALKMWFGK